MRGSPGRVRRLTPAVFAAVLLALAACNRGPARDALAEIEQSLAAVRPELAEYAPEALAGLDAVVRDVRARLDEGRYTDALRLAQSVPARVDAARASAASRKQALLAQWPPLAAALELRTTALSSRLAELAAAATPPRGLDPQRLVALQADGAALLQVQRDAAAAAQAGSLSRALRLGHAALAQADALAGALGMGVLSVPAPPPAIIVPSRAGGPRSTP